MTIEQTIDVPVSRRVTIEIPPQIPIGPVILTFSTVSAETDDCPLCSKHRDPKTGKPQYNAETLAAMQEAKDIAAGKIPGTWHHSVNEAREELGI